MAKLLDKLSTIFSNDDTLPWTESDLITDCEREAAKEGEDKYRCITRFAWALVHSRDQGNVQRGIAMLEASLEMKGGPLQRREILYLLAVGYYRAGDYSKSKRFVDEALDIAPDFRQALSLRNLIKDKIAKDGLIGLGLAAAAVGLVASGVAAALARKK